LFNLKFAAKGLERNAKKCEKAEREEKVKLKRVCLLCFTMTAAPVCYTDDGFYLVA